MAMDSSFDMFYPVDVSPYAQTVDYSRLPQYYNDSTSTLFDSDIHKPSNFSSTPATPPSVSAHPDPQIPTGSAASGPSIASAPSSAIGSPYSGHQVFQDQWVNTGHGLGLPAAVMPEFFPNEYAGGAVDIDGLYPEKLPYTHVGMCSIANLLRACANKKSRSLPDPTGAKWRRVHSHHLLSRPDQLHLLYRPAQLSFSLSRRIPCPIQRQCGAFTIAAPPRTTAITYDDAYALATGLGLRPQVLHFLYPIPSLTAQPRTEQH
jgi:hypothetical protein